MDISKKNLTTAQIALYAFLEYRGDQYTTLIDIAKALPEFYPYTESKNFHDTIARQRITRDIRALNESDDIEKIIISTNSGVKIATEQEFSRCIGKEYAAVFRKLNRIRKKSAKASKDGQAVFNLSDFGSEEELKEYEAFLRNPIRNGQNLGKMSEAEYERLWESVPQRIKKLRDKC